jgi:hypothetical protein
VVADDLARGVVELQSARAGGDRAPPPGWWTTVLDPVEEDVNVTRSREKLRTPLLASEEPVTLLLSMPSMVAWTCRRTGGASVGAPRCRCVTFPVRT